MNEVMAHLSSIASSLVKTDECWVSAVFTSTIFGGT